MVLSLVIPDVGKSKKIKDVVLNLLIFEWPLSSIQIYQRIKKQGDLSCTYQAVYKSLCELIESEVLIRNKKDYSINLDWLEKLKEFTSHIERNYKHGKNLPLFEGVLKAKKENNLTILTFDSIIEMDKAWMSIKKEHYQNTQTGDITFWEGNHCWWLLVYPELEYNLTNYVQKKKVKDFHIVHNDTPLDKLSKNFYEKAEIGYKIEKSKVDSDITVFGDTIMQVSWPEDLRKELDEIYNKCKSFNEVDVHFLLSKILTKKRNVNLILIKNKDLAEQLKRKVLANFEKDKRGNRIKKNPSKE